MKFKPIPLILLFLFAALFLTSCGAASTYWPGLAVAEDLAYVSAGSHVYAVRLSDGSEVWRYPEKASGKTIFYTPPVLTDDGQVVVGSAGSDHALFYLDARTGAYKSQFNGALARWMAAPLALGDNLYAPGGDGALYMLDLQGNKLKSFDTGAPLWSQPVSDGKYIYLAALNHHLYALDPQTLKVAWDVDLGGAMAGSPALSADGKLYVGHFASKVVALETETGKILWEAPTDAPVWGGPVLEGGLVYAADLQGKIYAFDTASGTRAWNPPQPNGPIIGSASWQGGLMVFATETGMVVGVDPEGKVKTLASYQGKIYTPPASAGDLILVAPMETEFVMAAIDANGLQVWNFIPEKK